MQVVDLQHFEHQLESADSVDPEEGRAEDRQFLSEVFEIFVEILWCYGLCKGPYLSKLKQGFIKYWLSLAQKHPDWNKEEICLKNARLDACGDLKKVPPDLEVCPTTYRCKILIALCKYKIAAFFSYLEKQAPPPCPTEWKEDKPYVLIGGVVNRWIRHKYKLAYGAHSEDQSDLMELSNREWIDSLAQAIKMGKRAMPRADTSMVWRSLFATFEKLTTKPVDLPYPSVEFLPTELFVEAGVTPFSDKETYHALLRFYVHEVMRDLDMSSLHSFEANPFAPSRSATFNRCRSGFGQAGDIALGGVCGNVREIFQDTVVDLASWSPNWEEARVRCEVNLSQARAAYYYSMIHCYEGYRKQTKAYLNDHPGEQYEVRYRPTSILAPIPEALKVRCVSKGPGEVALWLKPEQDAMLTHLSQFNRFCVGRKESGAEMLRGLGGMLSEDERALSIDYESSTDNLRCEFSELISQEIFDTCHVDPISQIIWRETLWGGCVATPCVSNADLSEGLFPFELWKKSEENRPTPMVRGQLMGNIVSFPILCLANGFCCWLSRMRSTGRYEHPLLAKYIVNGDDGVVYVNSGGKEFWEKLSSAMGFPPSVGKVYWSEHFFDFNSKFFVFRKNVLNPRWDKDDFGFLEVRTQHGFPVIPDEWYIYQVPFCYVSLCHGKARTGSNREISELMGLDRGLSLGSLQENCLDQAPKQTHEKLMSLFYTHLLYRPDIYRAIKGLPWYLPTCVGGLGLRPMLKEDYMTTVVGGRLCWLAAKRKGSFDLGEPLPYCSCERINSKGVVVRHDIGPGKKDLCNAFFVASDLAYHENCKDYGLRLPAKPKLVPNYNLTSPINLSEFTFSPSHPDDASAEAVWSFWGNIRRFGADLLKIGETRHTKQWESQIVNGYIRSCKQFWLHVKKSNTFSQGFTYIDGLRLDGYIDIKHVETTDEVLRKLADCKAVVDHDTYVSELASLWIRSRFHWLRLIPSLRPLLSLI